MFSRTATYLAWSLDFNEDYFAKSMQAYRPMWAEVWPELERMVGVKQPEQYHRFDVWEHSVSAFGFARASIFPRHIRLAALLHDIGKPATFKRIPGDRIRFNGHDEEGARMVEAILGEIGWNEDEAKLVVTLVREHMIWGSLKDMKARTRRKLYARPHFDDLFLLHRCDALAARGDLSAARYAEEDRQVQARIQAALPPRPEPVVTGQDMIDAGYPEGPFIGQVLASIAKEQLAGKITTREDALAYIAALGECC